MRLTDHQHKPDNWLGFHYTTQIQLIGLAVVVVEEPVVRGVNWNGSPKLSIFLYSTFEDSKELIYWSLPVLAVAVVVVVAELRSSEAEAEDVVLEVD